MSVMNINLSVNSWVEDHLVQKLTNHLCCRARLVRMDECYEYNIIPEKLLDIVRAVHDIMQKSFTIETVVDRACNMIKQNTFT